MTALFNAGSMIIKGNLRKNVLTNMKRKCIIKKKVVIAKASNPWA